MSSLTVALDFGGTGIKGFFTLDAFNPELFFLEPEVSVVMRQSLDAYERSKTGSMSPFDEAWIEYKQKFYAVGFLAKQKFQGLLQLQKRKFELAVPKVLAVIGAISVKHNLPNGTLIKLGVVFPWDEYQANIEFKQIIASALLDYKFRGQSKSFVLDAFACLPEGGGVLARGRIASASLKSQKVLVLMLGYRDASLLLTERGAMSRGITAKLGFSLMIQSIKERTSGLERNSLTNAVCKAGKNLNPKAFAFLTDSFDDEYKERELSIIRTAIKDAREEYWMMLSQWLKLEIPRDLDEIILAGGTANFFRAELNTLFKETKINWGEQLEKQLTANYHEIVVAKSLQYRLTDVYGLFFYLCGTIAKHKVLVEN